MKAFLEGPPARSRGAPALRWILQLARLLAFACALQLSGGAHVVTSVIGGAAACIDVCAGPCEDEPDDHCPPGCPNCSCPHGRLPSLPPSLEVPLPEQVAWDLPEARTPYHAGVPLAPPVVALYRPPRA